MDKELTRKVINFDLKTNKIIKYFTKYIWFEKAETIMAENPLRVVASAMRYANNTKDFLKLCKLNDEILKEALKQAQAGYFDEKSWHFWHYRLYGAESIVPKLPQRKFLNEIKA